MADLRIDLGAGDLDALRRSLSRVSGPALQARAGRKIVEGLSGLEPELRAAALEYLPRRGGLAGTVAAGRMTTRTSIGSGGVTVTVSWVSPPVSAAQMDTGRWRHPLFGDRERWYPQRTRKGWFTRTVRKKIYSRTRRHFDTLQGELEREIA